MLVKFIVTTTVGFLAGVASTGIVQPTSKFIMRVVCFVVRSYFK